MITVIGRGAPVSVVQPRLGREATPCRSARAEPARMPGTPRPGGSRSARRCDVLALHPRRRGCPSSGHRSVSSTTNRVSVTQMIGDVAAQVVTHTIGLAHRAGHKCCDESGDRPPARTRPRSRTTVAILTVLSSFVPPVIWTNQVPLDRQLPIDRLLRPADLLVDAAQGAAGLLGSAAVRS